MKRKQTKYRAIDKLFKEHPSLKKAIVINVEENKLSQSLIDGAEPGLSAAPPAMSCNGSLTFGNY